MIKLTKSADSRATDLTFCTSVLMLALGLAGCQHSPAARPEQAGTPIATSSAATGEAGVGAANPLAVEAGLSILKAGGSAADAAVAVQAALGLVEPQSSGLGGGAFLVYYDAKSGKVTVFDGRETAPAGATPDMFIGTDGKPLSTSTRSPAVDRPAPRVPLRCSAWRTSATASSPGATCSAPRPTRLRMASSCRSDSAGLPEATSRRQAFRMRRRCSRGRMARRCRLATG